MKSKIVQENHESDGRQNERLLKKAEEIVRNRYRIWNKEEKEWVIRRRQLSMINVAVVGTGNIAHAHVGGLLTFPERCKWLCATSILRRHRR